MLSPHSTNQKGQTGQIHDGRDDADHEKELSKCGCQEKGEVESKMETRPHEEK